MNPINLGTTEMRERMNRAIVDQMGSVNAREIHQSFSELRERINPIRNNLKRVLTEEVNTDRD